MISVYFRDNDFWGLVELAATIWSTGWDACFTNRDTVDPLGLLNQGGIFNGLEVAGAVARREEPGIIILVSANRSCLGVLDAVANPTRGAVLIGGRT